MDCAETKERKKKREEAGLRWGEAEPFITVMSYESRTVNDETRGERSTRGEREITQISFKT